MVYGGPVSGQLVCGLSWMVMDLNEWDHLMTGIQYHLGKMLGDNTKVMAD
jgi:hypothetical protein